jgi:type III secretion protein L
MQGFVAGPPLVVVLRADRPGLAPGAQRLRAADYACLVQADDALDTARASAEAIVGRADAVREQARSDGLQAGRGEARGELVDAVAGMSATLSRWVRETEPQLVAMVQRCVREVVRASDPDLLVRGSVARALGEMTTASEIRIQVHPAQLAAVRDEMAALATAHDLRGLVRVDPAPALQPGDCIVESPLGLVDLRVESQLRFVDQTLSPG